MANPILGEVEVEIGGRKFVLRPSFEGIIEMEAKSKQSLSSLLNKFRTLDLSMLDIVAVVWGGIIGAAEKNKNAPDFSEVGKLVMEHGFLKLYPGCAKVVGAAYSGKPIAEISAQEEAEEAKKKDAEQEPKT